MGEFSDRLVGELIDAVKAALKKEQSERLRDVYLIGDIDKDTARAAIERIRELANEGTGPINLYLNTAGGNVTDGLALHDAILQVVSAGHRGRQSSCRGWPTRWGPSCCRPPARAGASASRTRGS